MNEMQAVAEGGARPSPKEGYVSTMSFSPRARDAAREGVVARLSAGGWSAYHRMDCVHAPRVGFGVRDVVHGPWRYLAAHWDPCEVCRPPRYDEAAAA